MIQETSVEIGELEQRWVRLRRARDARRQRLRSIDELINEFEKLNLAEEREVPVELRGRVLAAVGAEGQQLARCANEGVSISEWMDALYDAQDNLMFGSEDGD
ncbi:MAG TPA: hypothetical protein VF155_05455 [Candidatus Dormibacteraeota bacterium]